MNQKYKKNLAASLNKLIKMKNTLEVKKIVKNIVNQLELIYYKRIFETF
jgi:hypothetical protein